MVYVYPAIFYKEETGGYSVIFPDLNELATQGDDLSDAIAMAEDTCGLYLFTSLRDREEIPVPSKLEDIKLDEEEAFVNLIRLDLNEYAKKHSDKAVKKTLSIPMWLNTICEEKNINYSKVLQEALIERVQVKG